MTPGDYYQYSLILLFVIIILLFYIAVSTYGQLKRSKDLEDAVYRLIEITKEKSDNK